MEKHISREYCKGKIGKFIEEQHASIILIYDDGDATVYYNTYWIENNIFGKEDIHLWPESVRENYQQTIVRNEFYIGDYENFANKVMTNLQLNFRN